ncbi:hypothetical protein F5877DRAFT_76054 [Lentinula edodes]|nr:hypothetical protein F5877DRAFT_76054 [Lentinula edodes]
MSQKNLTTLQSTLKESFYYLGNQRPLPEGCGWTSLDGKQIFSAGVTLADSAPTVIPFTVVGRVATNLNNTGLFGTWSRNSKYGAATARRSFQLGPPLDLGFRRDWAPAMARLKELQLAGANNSRKVQYLFVHKNVPPQDCILRAGARVFRDVEDGEENQGVRDAVPKDKKDDPAWIDIVETKNFAVFPLYDESGNLVPLRSVRPTIAGATVLLTFSFRCWRFEPTDPFSFAADVERVDVLIPANVRLSLPPTPPKTPQRSMQGVTPGHRVQALYTIESEDGMEFPRNVNSYAAPQTPPNKRAYMPITPQSVGTMVTTPSPVAGVEDSFASGNELQRQYNQYQNSPTALSERATSERRGGPEAFQPQYAVPTGEPTSTWFNNHPYLGTLYGSLGPVQNAPLLGLQPAFNPEESPQLRDTRIVGSFSESWSPPIANPHIHSQDGSGISSTENMDSQSRPTAVSKEATVADVSSGNSNKSGGERVAKRKHVDDSGGDAEQQHEPKRREIDNGMTAGLQE